MRMRAPAAQQRRGGTHFSRVAICHTRARSDLDSIQGTTARRPVSQLQQQIVVDPGRDIKQTEKTRTSETTQTKSRGS
jgi:hypothetical protein